MASAMGHRQATTRSFSPSKLRWPKAKIPPGGTTTSEHTKAVRTLYLTDRAADHLEAVLSGAAAGWDPRSPYFGRVNKLADDVARAFRGCRSVIQIHQPEEPTPDLFDGSPSCFKTES